MSFLVAFLGTAMALVGTSWAQLFIGPFLAVEAPEIFQTAGPPPGFLLSFFLTAIGLILFGVATLRARVYPRPASILLIIGAAITVLPLPFTGIILDVALGWLGFILFTGTGFSTGEQPSRVS